jgi:predicted  nucleic acid-binding Zn-ribbon protein
MKSIFDAIQENINTVNENVIDVAKRVASMEQEVIALSLMFKAPEQPNARGEEGVEVVSSEPESV